MAAIEVANNQERGGESGQEGIKSLEVEGLGRGKIEINDSNPML